MKLIRPVLVGGMLVALLHPCMLGICLMYVCWQLRIEQVARGACCTMHDASHGQLLHCKHMFMCMRV